MLHHDGSAVFIARKNIEAFSVSLLFEKDAVLPNFACSWLDRRFESSDSATAFLSRHELNNYFNLFTYWLSDSMDADQHKVFIIRIRDWLSENFQKPPLE